MKRNLVALFVFFLLAPSCTTSPPARFYVLGLEASGEVSERKGRCVVLGLGPIEVPAYLDRPEIVTRVDSHEVRPLDFHRWGEPLAQGISRVLADAISRVMCVERVEYYPWRVYLSVDLQVALRIKRFEATPGTSVHLVFEWTIYGSDPKRALKSGTWEMEEVINQEDIPGTVRCQSRLLEAAGRRLAQELMALADGQRPSSR